MPTERTSFGTKLRQRLDEQGISVRELARRIRPDDPETGRRNIARWLAPRDKAVTPSRATIDLVAEVLGVDTGDLLAEEDEESRQMAVDLLLVFQRVVDARLAVRT